MAEAFDLSDFHYAHRGLWRAEGPAENSLEAFLAAAEAGFGIEFDVRPSSDGVPIVFHDPVLDRMTGKSGLVAHHKANELKQMSLKSGEPIPTLEDLLAAWPRATPLLCELKIDGETNPAAFAQKVSDTIAVHNGPAAMMSFSADAVAAISPQIMRGLLISPVALTGAAVFQQTLSSELAGQVDYLALHHSDASRPEPQKKRETKPLTVWTVDNPSLFSDLMHRTDAQIFEGFLPNGR